MQHWTTEDVAVPDSHSHQSDCSVLVMENELCQFRVIIDTPVFPTAKTPRFEEVKSNSHDFWLMLRLSCCFHHDAHYPPWFPDQAMQTL